jgi:hypothetical protein
MSEELQQLQAAVVATRGVVKASIRSLRTATQFLADLDERIDNAIAAQTTAQPEEAQRNDNSNSSSSSQENST